LAAKRGSGIVDLDMPGFALGRFSPTAVPVPGSVAPAKFSPDGRWIVFSTGTPRNEDRGIYVQPFPGPGLRKQISGAPGVPAWRKDGKEIVIADNRGVWSVRVEPTTGGLRFSNPELLFSGLRWPAGSILAANPLAVSSDGSRIYFAQAVEQTESDFIGILMQWAK
jgi:hypothetical protein